MGFRYQVEVKITSWVDMAASYISWVVVSGLVRVGLLNSPAGLAADSSAAASSSNNSSTTAMVDSYFVLLDGCCPMSVPVDQLTRVIKRCLPVITYSSFLEKLAGAGKTAAAAAEESEMIVGCTVCMEGITGEEKVRELCNCCHVFHRECLDHWVDQGRVTCPLCRAMLFPDNLGLAQLRACLSSPSVSSPDNHDDERGHES